MKLKLYIILILVISLVACSRQHKEVKQENKPSVIVFEQRLKSSDFKNPFRNIHSGDKNKGAISFITGDSVIYFKPKSERDTLFFRDSCHYKEIRFKSLFEDYNYLIAPNDTVLFSVDDYGRPILKSQTSQRLTRLYNFSYKVKYRMDYMGYRPLTGLLVFGNMIASIESEKKNRTPYFEEDKYMYIPIDTLQKSFRFYQQNYQKELDSLRLLANIPKEYIGYLEYRYQLDNYTFELSKNRCRRGLSEKADATLFFDDKYMTYPSYREFILQYLRFFFNIKEKIPINRGKQSVNADWRKTYERLSEKGYPVKTKHFMQKHAIEKMSKLFSAKNIKKYLDDYLAQTGDSATVNAIVNPHRLSVSDKRMAAEKLLLKDMQGNKTTLEEVLKEHSGNVLYVDFWASWCVPCMSLMPDSKQLHKKYADRKIKFLYFSIDEDENAWKNAAKKVGIKANNYLVLNPKEAPIMKELKIHSIPRYLIFDKAGKLVDRDAPRPNEGQIETIFDKYLKE